MTDEYGLHEASILHLEPEVRVVEVDQYTALGSSLSRKTRDRAGSKILVPRNGMDKVVKERWPSNINEAGSGTRYVLTKLLIDSQQ